MIWDTFKARLARAYKSWTIWFHGIAGSVAAFVVYAKANIPELQPYIPSNWYHYMIAVLIAGAILLRFKTTQPLEAK
jgi:hypothetical protein